MIVSFIILGLTVGFLPGNFAGGLISGLGIAMKETHAVAGEWKETNFERVSGSDSTHPLRP